ncbi:MAG: DUF935 family protein [Gammaproteobacteria bacterium]|nr:DUF935 family protein [Gammaproteobacteria bacterium]
MRQGIYISPDEFVQFGEPSKRLSEQIATRSRSTDFNGLGSYLPNPDPVLKKLGRDIQVYRDLRADPAVGGAVRRRKAAVKAMEWGLDRERAGSPVAETVAGILADLDLERIIGEMLDAVLYGYQPMEILWAKVGSLIVPADIISKPPEWFLFGQDNALRFRSIDEPVNGETLPPNKFLLPRQDATFDSPYGFPDLSMCFWPVTFKKGGLKFWVSFTERYGTPWLIGKQPRGSGPGETAALLDSLEAMVQDAVAVIPDDASIEIHEAGGKGASAELYERLLMYCRSEISIALLGQNQTTEAESNRASAQAGFKVTRDIRDGDAGIVASALNTLIRWVCELNFGEVERPVFSLWEQEDVDKTLAERDETLAKAGARFSKGYFERVYGLQDGDLV